MLWQVTNVPSQLTRLPLNGGGERTQKVDVEIEDQVFTWSSISFI